MNKVMKNYIDYKYLGVPLNGSNPKGELLLLDEVSLYFQEFKIIETNYKNYLMIDLQSYFKLSKESKKLVNKCKVNMFVTLDERNYVFIPKVSSDISKLVPNIFKLDENGVFISIKNKYISINKFTPESFYEILLEYEENNNFMFSVLCGISYRLFSSNPELENYVSKCINYYFNYNLIMIPK